MKTGVVIIADENGNIVEENTVIIENDAATILCKKHKYDLNWDIQGR